VKARLLWLLPAITAVGVRLATGPHPIDDAFITFRYARNLAEGVGLVYNPGEWVLGTTAPLWALILGAAYHIGLTDLPWVATVISAACDAATAVLLASLARRIGWQPLGAALVGLAWALNPMSIGFATGGMETSLFVLLALTALTLASTRRLVVPAALVCGFATLVRPEGALLAGVVLVWTVLARRRQTVAACVAASVPIGAAGLLLVLRYGSPLPHSMAAKQVAYLPGWPLENFAALIIQAGLPGWSTYLLAVLPSAIGLLLACVGLATLVILSRRGLIRIHQAGRPWQPFAAFAALYFAFYVIAGLRGVRLFPWYLVPLAPFYLLAAAAGLARLRTATYSWLAAALVLWQLPAINWHAPFLPAGEDLAREDLYLSVGNRLAASLPANAVVAAPEIGALGYASNLRVLDTVGLVSPSAVAYYPLPADQFVADSAIPAKLIDDRQPDAVVTLDVFAERSLLPDPVFQRTYRLEAEYPSTVWQSQELLLFRRVDGQ
jgi:hypothetical protein